MNLHEYQSKQLFANMPFPCRKARWPARRMKAVTAARKLGGSLWVVKARSMRAAAARPAASR